MTFLNSLLNNLSDTDEQYQNEYTLWKNLYFLKNFNTRKCRCINNHLYNDEYNDITDEDEDEDDEYNIICKCEYPTSDENITQGDYTLLILKTNESHIIKLDDHEILLVMKYIKDKGVIINYNDLIYDETHDIGIKDCYWNYIIIKLYDLSRDDIDKFISQYKKNTLTSYATNYNALHIMSGLCGLKYSN